jgi:hypothetical protein
MYGQMTAGSWIYIGSQGIVQGTYETFVEAGQAALRRQPGGPLDPDRRPGRHGRRAAAGRHLCRRLQLNIECQQSRIDFRLRSRYVDEQATDLDDALARIARTPPRARPSASRLLGNAAEVLPELVQRGVANSARPGHRPDQRARPGQRLPACRLDVAQLAGRAGRRRPARRAAPGRGAELRGARAGHAGLPGHGRAHGGLRQQHPPGGVRRRREERLRLPRLRAGLRAAAVLPRQGAVPLGGAVGRPGRHPQDRRQDEGAVPGGRPPAPLAGHGRRAHRLPGPAGAHLLDRPGRAPPRRPGLQ